MLLELFKNLVLVAGCLFMLVVIGSIVTAPIAKMVRRKKTEKIIENLNKITKEAIEELKKECEAKSAVKKQPKKKTEKTAKKEEK